MKVPKLPMYYSRNTEEFLFFFKILCCLLGSSTVLWSETNCEFKKSITLSQIPRAPHHPIPYFWKILKFGHGLTHPV